MNGNADIGMCTIDYAGTATGPDAAFMNTPPPEPSSMTLMLIALALMCLILRRGRPYADPA